MITIAAIDDDLAFLEKCREITDDFFEKAGIPHEIKTYRQGVSVLEDIEKNLYFDILMIDIEMPEMNGMELAHQIRQIYDTPYIIFVTSYVQYSIRGYEYNAWRYIIKKEMAEKLPMAYESLVRRLKQKEEKFYIIERPKKILKLLYEDIYYIYKDGKNAVFVTRKCSWDDRVTLDQVLKKLDDPMFVRCERGNIANIRHIMSMEDNELTMRNGKKIPVSIKLAKTVRKSITEYWRKQN